MCIKPWSNQFQSVQWVLIKHVCVSKFWFMTVERAAEFERIVSKDLLHRQLLNCQGKLGVTEFHFIQCLSIQSVFYTHNIKIALWADYFICQENHQQPQSFAQIIRKFIDIVCAHPIKCELTLYYENTHKNKNCQSSIHCALWAI